MPYRTSKQVLADLEDAKKQYVSDEKAEDLAIRLLYARENLLAVGSGISVTLEEYKKATRLYNEL